MDVVVVAMMMPSAAAPEEGEAALERGATPAQTQEAALLEAAVGDSFGADAGLDVSLQQSLICVQEKGETGREG